MIGDGMGLGQITASMYLNKRGLYLEKFPVIGLQKTFSGNNLITDSAAGATAMACGVKTFNNGIGVNMDTIPVQSILELAEKNGLATGMIVTSSVVHGTPSPFMAHQANRQFKEAIALDFMNTDIDFLVGGGKKYFDRRESDDRNLYKELKEKGYFVSDYFKQDIMDMHIGSKKKFIFFTADDEPTSVMSGRKYLPYIASVGAKFLRKRNDKGFFLMIEGSQIDWGGHQNNAEQLIHELKDFNTAVGRILKFAQKDKETLVIVTADHETGGFAINNGSTKSELVPAFTTNGHTADLIPVFAFGPQSELFNGIYENTAIYEKMKKALRLKEEN
ncbi:MAG TPA: alkaline phosphatase [Phaeodactylibacter sp.]|nr:alkaline phosphatase [Phaeodactylibacter sp.]